MRIPQDLHQRAALYAEEHDLKLNAVVQLALKEYLTHAEWWWLTSHISEARCGASDIPQISKCPGPAE